MDPPRTPFLVITISLVLANLLTPGVSTPDNTDLLGCLTDQFNRSNMSTTGVIFTPSDPSYASLQQYENLRATSASPRKPLLIATPFNEPQIRATIYCSRQLGIQIRLRSGGHDYEGLSYISHDPFVIVDLRNFRSITIDETQKTAWVQTGATLGELYHAAATKVSKTLAFAAGVCPTVGVGGHISGGGYGMMSRKHGLASDRVLDAKLMNADGEILDRKSMGEDVFWSLRGGGSMSFGIILAFKLTLVDVPMIVTAFEVVRTSEENVTRLLNRWQLMADKVDENLLLRVTLHSRETNDGNRTVEGSFNALYLGRSNDLLRLMGREFPELGLLRSECNEMSWIDSVLFFASLRNRSHEDLLNRDPHHPYIPRYYKGKSDFVRIPIPTNGFRGIWRLLHEEAANRAAIEFSPFGGALSDYSETDSPFGHRAGVIIMIRYGITWDNDGEEELQKHMWWMRRLYGYMTPYVTKSPREAYFNYKDLDIGMNCVRGNTSYEQASVWGHKYYKQNFDRLVRAKIQVDPSNYFRNEQSIPSVQRV